MILNEQDKKELLASLHTKPAACWIALHRHQLWGNQSFKRMLLFQKVSRNYKYKRYSQLAILQKDIKHYRHLENIFSITFEKTINRTFIVERYFKFKAFWINTKKKKKKIWFKVEETDCRFKKQNERISKQNWPPEIPIRGIFLNEKLKALYFF